MAGWGTTTSIWRKTLLNGVKWLFTYAWHIYLDNKRHKHRNYARVRLTVTSAGHTETQFKYILNNKGILQDTQNNGKINIYDNIANGCFETKVINGSSNQYPENKLRWQHMFTWQQTSLHNLGIKLTCNVCSIHKVTLTLFVR